MVATPAQSRGNRASEVARLKGRLGPAAARGTVAKQTMAGGLLFRPPAPACKLAHRFAVCGFGWPHGARIGKRHRRCGDRALPGFNRAAFAARDGRMDSDKPVTNKQRYRTNACRGRARQASCGAVWPNGTTPNRPLRAAPERSPARVALRTLPPFTMHLYEAAGMFARTPPGTSLRGGP